VASLPTAALRPLSLSGRSGPEASFVENCIVAPLLEEAFKRYVGPRPGSLAYTALIVLIETRNMGSMETRWAKAAYLVTRAQHFALRAMPYPIAVAYHIGWNVACHMLANGSGADSGSGAAAALHPLMVWNKKDAKLAKRGANVPLRDRTPHNALIWDDELQSFPTTTPARAPQRRKHGPPRDPTTARELVFVRNSPGPLGDYAKMVEDFGLDLGEVLLPLLESGQSVIGVEEAAVIKKADLYGQALRKIFQAFDAFAGTMHLRGDYDLEQATRVVGEWITKLQALQLKATDPVKKIVLEALTERKQGLRRKELLQVSRVEIKNAMLGRGQRGPPEEDTTGYQPAAVVVSDPAWPLEAAGGTWLDMEVVRSVNAWRRGVNQFLDASPNRPGMWVVTAESRGPAWCLIPPLLLGTHGMCVAAVLGDRFMTEGWAPMSPRMVVENGIVVEGRKFPDTILLPCVTRPGTYQVGPTLAGWPAYNFSSCVHNSARGIYNRIGKLSPADRLLSATGVDGVFEAFVAVFTAYKRFLIREAVRVKLVRGAVPMHELVDTKKGIALWLRNFMLARRRVLTGDRGELPRVGRPKFVREPRIANGFWPCGFGSSHWAHWMQAGTFVKQEKCHPKGINGPTRTVADPRIIQQCSVQLQVFLGPEVEVMQAMLKDLWDPAYLCVYAGGMTLKEIGLAMENTVAQLGGYDAVCAVENDLSRFDSTVSRGAHMIAYYVASFVLSEDRLRALAGAEKYTSPQRYSGCKWTFRMTDGVRSGMPTTTVNNTLINGFVTIVALARTLEARGEQLDALNPQARSFVLGDDMYMICRREIAASLTANIVAAYRELGFVPEPLLLRDVRNGTFLSKALWPATFPRGEGLALSILPGRALMRTGWSITPYPHGALPVYLRAACLGLDQEATHLPVLRVWYKHLIRLCEAELPLDGQLPVARPARGEHWVLPEMAEWEQEGPGAVRRTLEENGDLEVASGDCSASEHIWHYYLVRYGLTQSDLLDLERFIEERISAVDAVWYHWAASRMVAVDCGSAPRGGALALSAEMHWDDMHAAAQAHLWAQ
jgi:hypothetical protein